MRPPPDRLRRTRALTQVAIAMLDDPTAKHYGYELAGQAGVRAGTLYPILTRLLERKWVIDGWEDASLARAERRPAASLLRPDRRGRGGAV